MSLSALLALDIGAIIVLTFGLYFPRHRRKNMVVAYLVVNIGVLALSQALSTAAVGAGVGFGLFGLLSIIRLRSAELDQEEIAYYFSALAIGLLGGVKLTPIWLTPALIGALLVALFIGDHPRLFRSYRVQLMTIDQAFTDELRLTQHLEAILDASIHQVRVRAVDLVRDTTEVEVRYRVGDQITKSPAPIERSNAAGGP